MNNAVTMALLLVKELRQRELLEEVIIANDINSLRVCANCGKLMNEGWSCNSNTYCSDKCLLADWPSCDLNDIKAMTDEELNASEIYWTTWEE